MSIIEGILRNNYLHISLFGSKEVRKHISAERGEEEWWERVVQVLPLCEMEEV